MTAPDLSNGGVAIIARMHDEDERHELTHRLDRFRRSREAIRAAQLLMDFLDPIDYAEVRVECEFEGFHHEEARWVARTRGPHVVWRRRK